MQTSANYNLLLFAGTDNVKRQDFVDNFTNIDSQMKIINDNSYPNVTATGTNAYVGSIDRIKSLGKGTKLTLFVGTDATGNCSLNLNSYGVKNIKDSFGNIVTNLKANIPYNICYNGTDFILQGKGGGGNATAAQITKGATATVDSGQVTGTLDLTNLVTSNIKSGITINGVAGSGTVVDTADAVLDPSYLITGYSGYDDGVKKAGTMTNRANTKFQICGYEGITEIIPHPSAPTTQGLITGKNQYNQIGYIDSNSQIQMSVNNLVPSNIVAGVPIGLYNGSGSQVMVGTATIASLGGCNIVSGSTAISPFTNKTATPAWYENGTSSSQLLIEITKLVSFTPKMFVGTITGSGSALRFVEIYNTMPNGSFSYAKTGTSSSYVYTEGITYASSMRLIAYCAVASYNTVNWTIIG